MTMRLFLHLLLGRLALRDGRTQEAKKFWGHDHDADLNLWIREVKEGKIPNFGAHLIY